MEGNCRAKPGRDGRGDGPVGGSFLPAHRPRWGTRSRGLGAGQIMACGGGNSPQGRTLYKLALMLDE